jgi:hypothetical protein
MGFGRTSAHRREQTDLISGSKRPVGTRILLVHRNGQGGQDGFKLRESVSIARQQIVHTRAFREIEDLAGLAYHTLQDSKHQHADLH